MDSVFDMNLCVMYVYICSLSILTIAIAKFRLADKLLSNF